MSFTIYMQTRFESFILAEEACLIFFIIFLTKWDMVDKAILFYDSTQDKFSVLITLVIFIWLMPWYKQLNFHIEKYTHFLK